MINFPYNVPLMSSIMPSQNVPVQTSQNFQPFQQPQMVTQQMQTTPSIVHPTNAQDPFKPPFYQLHQADMFVANQNQYLPNIHTSRNPYPPTFQTYPNVPSTVQTQPNYGALPQNVLDQIRNCVSSTAPIFILPGGCHQQTGLTSQGGVAQQTGQPTNVTLPASIQCPPSFYPYPIPMPMFDPFGPQTQGKISSRGCSCCQRRQDSLDRKSYPVGCCCNIHEQEEHQCTATRDDTICSKRNCPASISLQALASQFLSLPGIISCAATRLILRKIPGSNITSAMEDTMDKAQKSIAALNKKQLLVESRNAQQVNALINLHMTTNPPANIIPLITLLQLKVNTLKAQVESLINKKVMECQGYGFEVETSGPIDPTILSMKTNEELRQLLTALRQKETDEHVNMNFSPYYSQKVIAESRLNNVQAKIRQVELEFDRRRGVPIPISTLSSAIVQQFSEARCTFDFAQTRLFEPYVQGRTLDSPDPFEQSIRNTRRLYLKPREPERGTMHREGEAKAICTSENGTSTCKDTGTGEGAVVGSKEKAVESKSSVDTCSCEESSSEESLNGDKKKLRLKIDEKGKVTITSVDSLKDVSLLKLASRVVVDVKKLPANDFEQQVPARKKYAEEMDKKLKDERLGDSEVELVDVRKTDTKNTNFERIVINNDNIESDANTEKKIQPTSIKTKTISDDVGISIKKEPESGESKLTTDYKDISIITEPESVLNGVSTAYKDISVKKEPETIKDEVTHTDIPIKIEPQENGKNGDDDNNTGEASFATTPTAQRKKSKEELKTPDKILLRGKEIMGNLEDTEFRDGKFPPDETGESKEKPIIEDVTVNLPSANEASQMPGNSFDLYRSSFKAKLTKSKEQLKNSDFVSNENGTSPVGSESRKQDKNGKYLQIVSMMTHVKYDNRFDSFWKCNINQSTVEKKKDECRRNIKNISLKDTSNEEVNEDDVYFLLNEENSSTTSGNQRHKQLSMIPVGTEIDDEIQRNAFLEKMFPKNCRNNGEKMINGLRRFPPLKHTYPKIAETTTNISEDIFHRKGIESSSTKIVCDRSSSYHRESKVGNNTASAIYSTIENQLISFNSLLSNIPNLQDILSNLHFNKLNKDVKSQKKDCTLLPSNTNAFDDSEYGISGGYRVSVSEQCSHVHEMKHSIIVDEEKKNYLLIRGSVSDQLQELSRNGFKRPCYTRRSLVIRSRLKNTENSKQECLHPFTIIKRLRKNKIVTPQAPTRIEHHLKVRERFLTLPRIPEDVEMLDHGNHTNDYIIISENAITQQSSEQNTDDINNCSAAPIDHSSSVIDRVMNDNPSDLEINKQV
ncbi:hypothetical protein WN48_00649 [Eufriesea mexicana]|uniref:Uncharacterized protein n=1 Tax=Eufriesea mexicana TaxID=516756 RepID=A0A310SEG6_9HYME|nr:hypothetical protein WN48_00649 [Eufriesea mexicana]